VPVVSYAPRPMLTVASRSRSIMVNVWVMCARLYTRQQACLCQRNSHQRRRVQVDSLLCSRQKYDVDASGGRSKGS